MISADPHDLAFSMVRLYGKSKAFMLADKYAGESTASGDLHGHTKWAATVIVIAAMIDAGNAVTSAR